jgi:uncharacterized protein YcfJ
MKKLLMTSVLSTAMVVGTVQPTWAYHYRTPEEQARHHRHIKTAERIGIGAAGGAVVGGLAAGGTGAGVGLLAGGTAGYLYDRHKRHHRHHTVYYYQR